LRDALSQMVANGATVNGGGTTPSGEPTQVFLN
jgi:hypothetical protein